LTRVSATEIVLMFSHRKAIGFHSNRPALTVYGAAHAVPLRGVTAITNDIIGSINSTTTSFTECAYRVVYFVDGKCGILTRSPSSDLGQTYDPFVLDGKHDATIFQGSREVIGTPWRPAECTSLEECACDWCRGGRKRRLAAIAKAIAGDWPEDGA
jgi:hypothetical protein